MTPEVLEFCERLSPGQSPLYVDARPEEWALPYERFENVRKKVQRSGGSLIYGWQISEVPELYLEARIHAVWESPTGAITHVSTESARNGRILFLRDPARKLESTGHDLERFPLVNNPLLPSYWHAADGVRRTIEKFASAGFDIRHPVVCRELAPLVKELQSLSRLLLGT